MTRLFPICIAVLLLSAFQKPADFNRDLIVELCKLTNCKLPTTIEVKLVDEKTLQDDYRSELLNECLQRTGGNFPGCARMALGQWVFIYGRWEASDDPTELKIVAFREAGIETIAHEYFHWYLHHMTTPRGLLNTEDVAEKLARQILTTPDFIKWLEEHK